MFVGIPSGASLKIYTVVTLRLQVSVAGSHESGYDTFSICVNAVVRHEFRRTEELPPTQRYTKVGIIAFWNMKWFKL
jgi:hypothetical protein